MHAPGEAGTHGPAGLPLTVREAVRHTAAQLHSRTDLRDKSALDAEQLVEIATGLTRVQMLTHPELALDEAQRLALRALVERRLQAEPIQHLRGSQEFYGRSFRVSPDVLIPRPETEDIVTAVLEHTPDRNAPLRIADVGTGSGVLAITLALELPLSRVLALDISPAALRVAEANALALGASGRIRFATSDLLSAAPPGECFDIVVSNPPYVPLSDAPTLHAEVYDHEPHTALFGGADGHDVLRRLIPQARAHLAPGGILLLETGGRTPALDALLEDWLDVTYRRDLQGIERVAFARR